MKASMLFKQVAIGVGLSAVLVGTAMADPVDSFDYTQEFEFVDPIVSESGNNSITQEGSTSGIDDVDGVTKLSWGTESNATDQVSSLIVNPCSTSPVVCLIPLGETASTTPSGYLSNGTITVAESVDAVAFGLGPVVVHNNFIIQGDALASTAAEDNVILSPFGGGADQVQNITFGVDFLETNNNAGNPGACPADVAFNALGCGDIFALSGGLLGLPTTLTTLGDAILADGTEVLAFLIDSFLLDGYIYDVFISAPGLGLLSDAACVAVGGAGNEGCIGFTTFEGEVNAFQLAFAIVAREAVPEPATLALLAGSLLLMGLVRRKKISSLSA